MTIRTPDPEVSIVMPLFNEEASLTSYLGEVFEVMESKVLPVDCELVIVDDGSTDGSRDLVQKISFGRADVMILHHERNLGMGAAYATGIARARGQHVYLLPADGSFDLRDMRSFLPPPGDRRMVIGRRTGYRATHSSWRCILSDIQNRLFRAAIGFDLRNFCGVNLLPTAPLKASPLRSRSHVATIEAVITLINKGWIPVDSPIEVHSRRAGRSKILTPRGLIRAAFEMSLLAGRTLFDRCALALRSKRR